MKTKEQVLAEIRNSDNPEATARAYLTDVIPMWMPDHLAKTTRNLVNASCGCADRVNENLFN